MALSKRPTMRAIAEKLGVSAMTVSMALRNHPRIGVETRERVKRAAEAMGYFPDPAMSALVNYRNEKRGVKMDSVLAVLMAEAEHVWMGESGLFAGMKDRALRLGYDLQKYHLDARTSFRRHSNILYNRKITGLIVPPISFKRGVSIDLDWKRFAGVHVGRSLPSPDLHRVTVSHFMSIKLVLEKLLNLGYRRIGLALPDHISERIDDRWVGGFINCRFRDNKGRLLEDILEYKVESEEGRAHFVDWLNRNRPDVVIGHRDELYGWLKAEGLDVPQNIGLVLLRDDSSPHDIARIKMNYYLIGQIAISLLHSLLVVHEKGVPDMQQTVSVPGEWVRGKTLRRQRY